MTPKERADFLIEKFKEIQYPDFQSEQQAKKCASILCDTIMDSNINLECDEPKRYIESVYNYYYLVKRQING
jgi:hypothetical protein